jgi:hypothetical protein
MSTPAEIIDGAVPVSPPALKTRYGNGAGTGS